MPEVVNSVPRPARTVRAQRPERLRSPQPTTTAAPVSPVLKLTAADVPPGYTVRHIQLCIPDRDVAEVEALLRYFNLKLGAVTVDNFRVLMGVLAEKKESGRPSIVSFEHGEFKVRAMPRRWWQLWKK